MQFALALRKGCIHFGEWENAWIQIKLQEYKIVHFWDIFKKAFLDQNFLYQGNI